MDTGEQAAAAKVLQAWAGSAAPCARVLMCVSTHACRKTQLGAASVTVSWRSGDTWVLAAAARSEGRGSWSPKLRNVLRSERPWAPPGSRPLATAWHTHPAGEPSAATPSLPAF